jgi:hypothetical protein
MFLLRRWLTRFGVTPASEVGITSLESNSSSSRRIVQGTQEVAGRDRRRMSSVRRENGGGCS